MTEVSDRQADIPPSPGVRDIAREEFWIVARSFFAPIYGTLLVWKRLSRLTRRVDRGSAERPPGDPPLQPAE
jgi:hypothetical protein